MLPNKYDKDWVREAVTTTVKRPVHHIVRNEEGETGFVTEEELVTQHDIYRRNDKKSRAESILWFRGARVC